MCSSDWSIYLGMDIWKTNYNWKWEIGSKENIINHFDFVEYLLNLGYTKCKTLSLPLLMDVRYSFVKIKDIFVVKKNFKINHK